MARTMTITASMDWPLEDGQQAAKLPLSFSVAYTDQTGLEKTYAAPISNDPIPLPPNGAKAIILRAKTANVDVKINGSATAITLKAGNGFIIITNGDGNVTSLTATVVTAPAKLEGYAFA